MPKPELWLRGVPLSDDLAARLRAAAGDGLVIDCGVDVDPSIDRPVLSRFDLGEAFACGEAARARGAAFQVLFQQPGRRWSERVVGLVGSGGSLRRFGYDAAPCAEPGCAPSFEVEPCARPVMTAASGTAAVTCGAGRPSDSPYARQPGP